MKNQHKALVVGATGATGRDLVSQLIESDRFGEVSVIVRRELDEWRNFERDKFKVHLVESLVELETGDWSSLSEYDACFNTLGTHIIAPNDQMKTVNLDYAVASGRLASKLGIRYYAYLSGMGANPRHFFYLAKVKGLAEQALGEMGFEHFTSFRIRSIRDRANENDVRSMDKILGLIPFKSLSLETNDLAKILIHDCLFNLGKTEADFGTSILSGGDMVSILEAVSPQA